MVIFNFSLLFILISTIKCLNLDKFCKNTKSVCTGQYGILYKYTKLCKKMECTDKFSIKCGDGICSDDQTNCNFLHKFTFLLNSFDTFQNDFKGKFFKAIKDCSFDYPIPTKNEMCLNEENCYTDFENRTIIKTNCPCLGKINFECGEKLCTRDSLVCDYVLKNNFWKKIVSQCGNGNIFIPNYTLTLRKISKIFK